jgi:hypothetical protein
MIYESENGHTNPIRAKHFGVFEKIRVEGKAKVVLFGGTECFSTEVARMMLDNIRKDFPEREFFVSTLN